jgi:formylglycine-generating enzyme required for sulfatase activity
VSVGLVGVVLALVTYVARRPTDEIACGAGFFRRGVRCCVSPEGACGVAPACPRPLVHAPSGDVCVAPRARVLVPETTVLVGPSDWEAEGRVRPRNVHVASFEIDAFEAQRADVSCPSCVRPDAAAMASGDLAVAASGLSLDLARAYCRSRGGRLPTDDEWLVAAAGAKPRRYPWGDTGAVCRRGAWGLVSGPCAHEGNAGPDTVGAHPDGDTELGLHDMAGNVAEWTERSAPGQGRLRGGSYATSLATELRTWAYRDVDGAPRVDAGVRCAYDVPR